MYQLDKELQLNKFHRFHLLCGEELYLVRAYRRALVQKLSAGEDDMNCLIRYGEEADMEEMADFGMLSPFMAERRLIVIIDSAWFSGGERESVKSGNDRLIELLGNLPETTSVIFAERSVNKKNGRYAFFSGKLKSESSELTTKNMLVTEFKKLSGIDLINWIAGYAARSDTKITKKAAHMLPERLGNDMFILSQELDKLIGYCAGKKQIREEDIEAITGGVVSTRVYEMVDAVSAGNTDRALQLYQNLIYNKESVDEIMRSLGRQFDTLYRLKSFEGSGIPMDDIAKRVGMPDAIRWKAGSFMKTAAKFRYEKLENLVNYWAELDEQVKTIGLNRQVATELFLIQALTN
ncbi:MAG: DNA polymerase III subunit delta [Eubacterium sp.]|nr:DNA polymerase III subunit delta [Eubacterium sp.]